MPTLYSPDFFDLQIQFAQQVARIHGTSLSDGLLHYTHIPLHFLRRPFHAHHPLWQEYLQGLEQASNKAEWTYQFCIGEKQSTTQSPYGCFHYYYQEDEQVIRIHFMNEEQSSFGPLSKERLDVRMQELKKMFLAIKKQHPKAQKVKGRSWLYNITAYKRLFPHEYTLRTYPETV